MSRKASAKNHASINSSEVEFKGQKRQANDGTNGKSLFSLLSHLERPQMTASIICKNKVRSTQLQNGVEADMVF